MTEARINLCRILILNVCGNDPLFAAVFSECHLTSF